jgi:hypothetical protein
MMKKSSVILFMLIVFGGAACADRSPDDVEREKASQELNSYRLSEGLYVGDLFSEKDRKSLGDLSLSLKVVTSLRPSSQGVAPVQTLSLGGQFWLQSEEELFSFEFNSGFFNPDSGEVDIEFEVPRPNGESASFKIWGFIEEDRFRGRMEATDFSDRAAVFDLTRENKDPRAHPSVILEKMIEQNLELGEWSSLYDGKEVTLKFYEPIQDADERFVRFFVPEVFINMVLDFFGDVQVVFNNSKLDTRTGVLKGVYQMSTTYRDVMVYLDCRGQPGKILNELWKCRFTNLGNGVLIDFDFRKMAASSETEE